MDLVSKEKIGLEVEFSFNITTVNTQETADIIGAPLVDVDRWLSLGIARIGAKRCGKGNPRRILPFALAQLSLVKRIRPLIGLSPAAKVSEALRTFYEHRQGSFDLDVGGGDASWWLLVTTVEGWGSTNWEGKVSILDDLALAFVQQSELWGVLAELSTSALLILDTDAFLRKTLHAMKKAIETRWLCAGATRSACP